MIRPFQHVSTDIAIHFYVNHIVIVALPVIGIWVTHYQPVQ